MERTRKIIVAVIIGVLFILITLAVGGFYYYSQKKTAPVSQEAEQKLPGVPEVYSGTWPLPQKVSLPLALLSGNTLAAVKEVRASANEILADVSLPKVADESGAVPAGGFQSREFILAVSDKTAIERLAPKQQKDLKLSDVKSGDKIQISYSGDILNPQTSKLTVSSVKIYQSAK